MDIPEHTHMTRVHQTHTQRERERFWFGLGWFYEARCILFADVIQYLGKISMFNLIFIAKVYGDFLD